MPQDLPGNGTRLSVQVVTVIVSWLVAALVTYGAMKARVDVLEDRDARTRADIMDLKDTVAQQSAALAEIKADVKRLLERRR